MNPAARRGQPPQLEQLVRDIEAAIASGDPAAQSAMVVRSADALTRRWSRLAVADKPLFDGLLVSLLGQVDETARLAFAACLTPLRRAPRQTTTLLAGDASMRVAGPLLRDCPSFDAAWLTEIVAACGDVHRRAVARRPRLEGDVVAALIEHGGPSVVAAVLSNPGAILPAGALPSLKWLAVESEAVAIALGGRADLPAGDRAALVELAAARARASLAEGDALDAPTIEALLTDVSEVCAAPVSPERAARFTGAAAVANEAFGPRPVASARLERWVGARRLEDVLAAVARDAGLPVTVAVACHDARDPAALTVLLRGLEHPWSTLKTLLRERHGGMLEPAILARAHRFHTTLSPLAARRTARYAAAERYGSAFARFTADDR